MSFSSESWILIQSGIWKIAATNLVIRTYIPILCCGNAVGSSIYPASNEAK